MKSFTWQYGVLVYSHDGRVPSAHSGMVSALGRKRCALLWKVRCAAIHSSTRDGGAVAALGGEWLG